MSYVAGALAIVAGVFCSAGLLELGAAGAELCQYELHFATNRLTYFSRPDWLRPGAFL
jgi:hypothetical protein